MQCLKVRNCVRENCALTRESTANANNLLFCQVSKGRNSSLELCATS